MWRKGPPLRSHIEEAAYLKQLDICVEEVTLCDVYPLKAQLMDELQNASCDDSFSACSGAGKGTL